MWAENEHPGQAEGQQFSQNKVKEQLMAWKLNRDSQG